MPPPTSAGRQVEILFADSDRVVVVDAEEDDPAIGPVIVDALDADDPDAAERLIRSRLGPRGRVSRRP
jgi:hypothetical protein